MDLSKVFSNSIRTRIMQYIGNREGATTKEIADYLSDVPVPTLYRHINFLIETGMINVKEERKVRGSRERLLAANWEWNKNMSLSEMAYPFLMDLYNRFYQYEQSHSDKNIMAQTEKDRLFMLQTLVYLSDDEMDAFIKEYFALREKYMKISDESKGKKGKLRNINIVSVPAEIQ